MRIGIDIDCVCNDLVVKWLQYLNTKYNLNVKYSDITQYYINQFFPTLNNEQIYEPLNLIEFWESLSPNDDSIYYIQQLINDGHVIKLITATDVKNMPIKVKWILKHYPYLNNEDIWMVFDKSWINTEILLDDSIDNVENGEFIGICYAQPWNKTYNGFRVNNWKEFYMLINKINKDFKEVNL